MKMQNPNSEQATVKRSSGWKSVAVMVVVLGAAYFINVEVQTYLSRAVLEKTGLELLSFDAALARSAETGKPVLVEMSAIWCGSCRVFDRTVLTDPAVNAMIRERFVFARVEYDAGEGDAFMQRYGITGFPHALVVDHEGEVIVQLKIMRDPEAFGLQLQRVLGQGEAG